jgi:tetratricopeptide (TPR) repeat protein
MAQSRQLVGQLNKEFPVDTLIQEYALPTIRAVIELQNNNPNGAIDLLKTAARYEMGRPNMDGAGGLLDNLYPAYVRGQAYLRAEQGPQAAAEFQKMIDHPGIMLNFVTGALAHLQLGRAQAMMGDKAAARKSYQDFLTLWKDADPDIPIYQQAQAEYAKLQKFKP